MLYPVKVTSPNGQHIKTIPTQDLFIADEKYAPKKPAQLIGFMVITCRYCKDKVRVRISVRGIVRRICKKSQCRHKDDKDRKAAKLKIERGSRGSD